MPRKESKGAWPLALRLATYLYIEKVSGDQPLVLLDDVFSNSMKHALGVWLNAYQTLK